MNRKLFIAALVLCVTACVPITPEPAVLEPSTREADTTNCSYGYLSILPGQGARDLISDDLPDYLDIVKVESSLEGETLTAIFYLRGIPEEMAFNREGVENMVLEYMWTVEIHIEGDIIVTSDQADYTFSTFYTASRVRADTPAQTRPFKNAVQTEVWKNEHHPEENVTYWIDVLVYPRLIVSHEDNTLTLISRIPGITDESTLLFSTFDILEGQDGVSCQPA